MPFCSLPMASVVEQHYLQRRQGDCHFSIKAMWPPEGRIYGIGSVGGSNHTHTSLCICRNAQAQLRT